MAESWPADKVERWPVAKLVPNARNARTHSDEQIAQLAASIEEWGWTMPVLIDEDDRLIAGHGRVLAAQKLGLVDIPVMIARGWSEAQKHAYALADNKLTLNGEWDMDQLAIEIAELRASDFDVSLAGFNESEIEALLREPGSTDQDAEWHGMPEFDHEDKTAFQSVVVHFPNQEAINDFVALVKLPITPQTRFMWFPQTIIERYADKRYKSAE